MGSSTYDVTLFWTILDTLTTVVPSSQNPWSSHPLMSWRHLWTTPFCYISRWKWNTRFSPLIILILRVKSEKRNFKMRNSELMSLRTVQSDICVSFSWSHLINIRKSSFCRKDSPHLKETQKRQRDEQTNKQTSLTSCYLFTPCTRKCSALRLYWLYIHVRMEKKRYRVSVRFQSFFF